MQTRSIRLRVQGCVQGVGFRPFVYNLALQKGLNGYVLNSPQGVEICAEGPAHTVAAFLQELQTEKPALVTYQDFDLEELLLQDWQGFEIRPSVLTGDCQAVVLPDLAICQACSADMDDPQNRRFGYAFTNCTNCGPRYSIIAGLPYDRPKTSMAAFEMCPACLNEYSDPRDRRFHAQPNACADCGPELVFFEPPCNGPVSQRGQAALQAAIQALEEGKILALKGLGGFQLICDATAQATVLELRRRKNRQDKPLALMLPDLQSIQALCFLSEAEADMLQSPAAPILLLRRRAGGHLAPAVTQPGNPLLGVMLPTTPLHRLLTQALQRPLVATSGNRTQEPLAWRDHEALERLGSIADIFLSHNREILRPVDDSVLRYYAGKPVVLRRARGFAPLPIPLAQTPEQDFVAVGGHLKNSLAFAQAGRPQALLSPHLGDLDQDLSIQLFDSSLTHFQALYRWAPQAVARDSHPDYYSSLVAEKMGIRVWPVQHHHAHVLACMAEHQLQGPVLGFAWDGLGLGEDGQLWGGEALEITAKGNFLRRASFEPLRFAGGEKALRKPAYQAYGWLWQERGESLGEALGEAHEDTLWQSDLAPLKALNPQEKKLLNQALKQDVNCLQTSSVGRLFDAVASLLDLCHVSSFEGQAAMALEYLAEKAHPTPGVDYALREKGGLFYFPTSDLLTDLLQALAEQRPKAQIAYQFHWSLAQALVKMAIKFQIPEIVLTGGCFQNALLHQLCREGLQAAGFKVYWPQLVPPNDGGLALGQLYSLLLAQPLAQPPNQRSAHVFSPAR
jgi:hydrogenase maturation protein HypF